MVDCVATESEVVVVVVMMAASSTLEMFSLLVWRSVEEKCSRHPHSRPPVQANSSNYRVTLIRRLNLKNIVWAFSFITVGTTNESSKVLSFFCLDY